MPEPWELELPEVRRIPTDTGSYIEPPLEQDYSDDEKIAWHAAVIALDTGATIRVFAHFENHRRSYSIMIPGHYSGSSRGFQQIWEWLNGFDIGYRTARNTNA
ncbi:MAG TPA: hypothetical protein VHK27_13730 [Gammaproteobacteria bacterium]|nr:hypothetical protein [Gammaproteobacteria bacterium]